MYRKKKHSLFDLKLMVSLLCFFPSFTFLFSQNKLDSVSELNYTLVNGWKGSAFYKVTQDQKKEGPFLFNTSSISKDSLRFISDIRVSGNYTLDKKNGDWNFIHSLLQRGDIAQVRDFQITYDGKGKTHSVLGQFQKNLPNEKWAVFTQEVKNGEIIDTTFSAQTDFSEGQMVGTFKSKCNRLSIKGLVTENGHFNGTWTFDHSPNSSSSIQEKRIYEDGLLIQHLFIEDNQTFEIEHIGIDSSPDDANETWESLSINQDYFDVISFSSFYTNKEKLAAIRNTIKASNDFLMSSMNSFSLYENRIIWDLDTINNSFILPKIKLKKYTYTTAENKEIEEALANIENSKTSIEYFLRNPQVDIIKHKHEEIALYFEVYTEYLKHLSTLENVFQRLQLNSFEFINRTEIFPFIFNGINYSEIIHYEYNNEIKEEKVNFPNNVSVSDVSIPLLSKQSQDIYQHIIEINDIVAPIIELHQKRIEIADKEEELVALRDTIQKLFTDEYALQDYNNFHEQYSKDIISFIEKSFKEYAQKDIEERIRVTDEYIACFNDFVETYSQFSSISERINDIQELYTRVVWNPFTFTDMEEIVKERVFNAYQNYLLPAYLDNLGSQINCTNIRENMNHFDVLFSKMLELREEDTKELERELRRVSDIEKITQLFELELK